MSFCILGPADLKQADLQLEWIKHVLSSSSANYILVGGHFPVYSAGMHGNTQCLIEKLKPVLEENKVTAFLAGHDHNNQVRETGMLGGFPWLSWLFSVKKIEKRKASYCAAFALLFYTLFFWNSLYYIALPVHKISGIELNCPLYFFTTTALKTNGSKMTYWSGIAIPRTICIFEHYVYIETILKYEEIMR